MYSWQVQYVNATSIESVWTSCPQQAVLWNYDFSPPLLIRIVMGHKLVMAWAHFGECIGMSANKDSTDIVLHYIKVKPIKTT